MPVRQVPPDPGCRSCGAPLRQVVADLGATPLANSYLAPDRLNEAEVYYPLKAYVCGHCFLVQLEAFADPAAVFSDYAYFSSYSDTLLEHSRSFAVAVAERLGLRRGERVIEVASNDGYLLQYFLEQGLDVLGIEPAANIASVAEERGVKTLVRFFGTEVARELAGAGTRARLVVANNVIAHTPHLNDFIAGLKLLLAPGGTLSVEFHHLYHLIVDRQFDNIYHEHFQYFSLAAAREALARHGLSVTDVEELSTQGGSLRVSARHVEEAPVCSARVAEVLACEESAGLRDLARYESFSRLVRQMKVDLLAFLIRARQEGRSVVCYGAAAKGNTLLNYCGVRADLVEYAVDRSPYKQGLFLPGSRIPIYHPDRMRETKPDYVLILPWNLRDEIVQQMSHIREWGGRFVVPIPEIRELT